MLPLQATRETAGSRSARAGSPARSRTCLAWRSAILHRARQRWCPAWARTAQQGDLHRPRDLESAAVGEGFGDKQLPPYRTPRAEWQERHEPAQRVISAGLRGRVHGRDRSSRLWAPVGIEVLLRRRCSVACPLARPAAVRSSRSTAPITGAAYTRSWQHVLCKRSQLRMSGRRRSLGGSASRGVAPQQRAGLAKGGSESSHADQQRDAGKGQETAHKRL